MEGDGYEDGSGEGGGGCSEERRGGEPSAPEEFGGGGLRGFGFFGLLGEVEDLAAVGAVGQVGEGVRSLVRWEGVGGEGVELVGIEVLIEGLGGLLVFSHG